MNGMNQIIYTTSRARNRHVRELKDVVKLYNTCNKRCIDFNPRINFVTIMACHADTQLKLKVIINNLKYLAFANNKIVIIGSVNARFHTKMVEYVSKNYPTIEIYGIPNTTQLDAGKWNYYLTTYYTNNANFVVLTNDSYMIKATIQPFYNAMMLRNRDLYGYNDSSLITYHYQSYLFGIAHRALNHFTTHYARVKPFLNSYMDVVGNIELKLTDIFQSKDCFLKIANIPSNKSQNIFFSNDYLYNILQNLRLLPFIKVKRMRSLTETPRNKIDTINIQQSSFKHNSILATPRHSVNVSPLSASFTLVKNSIRLNNQKQPIF